MFSRLTKIVSIFCAIGLIAGCSMLKPYQAEIGQGNFVRADQFEQLEIGQTTNQVLFILGTPLLTGEQRDQRWIYPTLSDNEIYNTLIITFENGLVSSISQK